MWTDILNEVHDHTSKTDECDENENPEGFEISLKTIYTIYQWESRLEELYAWCMRWTRLQSNTDAETETETREHDEQVRLGTYQLRYEELDVPITIDVIK